MIECCRVQCVMGQDQLAKCRVERRVARNGTLQKLNSLAEISFHGAGGSWNQNERFRPAIEIKSDDVRGRALLDRALLGGREPSLQLVGNSFGNLTLDGKDIGQIAVVGLRP